MPSDFKPSIKALLLCAIVALVSYNVGYRSSHQAPAVVVGSASSVPEAPTHEPSDEEDYDEYDKALDEMQERAAAEDQHADLEPAEEVEPDEPQPEPSIDFSDVADDDATPAPSQTYTLDGQSQDGGADDYTPDDDSLDDGSLDTTTDVYPSTTTRSRSVDSSYSPPYIAPTPDPLPSYNPPVAENGSYYGEISEATGRPKTVHVRPYFRKDGTYVRGHTRSPPKRRN